MDVATSTEESVTQVTPERVTRRRMFRWLRRAAAASAGAVVASSLLDASQVSATGTGVAPASADGDALQVGGNNVNTSAATTLNGNAAGTFMMKVTNGSGIGTPIGLSGEQTSSSPTTGAGVSGFASGAQAAGVLGNSVGANGYGLKGIAATGAQLLLVDSAATMPPIAGTWVAGSFVVTGGHVWYCHLGGVGSASKWVKLSSTLVTLDSPARVYDSRGGDGPLGVGQERAVAVTGTFGATTIPSGVSSVLTNLTCAGPSGSGYLAMFKDGTTWSGTSNVNYVAGVDTANNATSAVSAGGKVRVLCGGSGPTNFIVDVFGYYL